MKVGCKLINSLVFSFLLIGMWDSNFKLVFKLKTHLNISKKNTTRLIVNSQNSIFIEISRIVTAP